MTPDQITRIEDSWGAVRSMVPELPALFYARLFTIDPDVKSLFKGDMAEQGEKLVATLSAVVANLRQMDILGPIAADLAKRHVAYGVQPEHYPAVGEALIWTLNEGTDGLDRQTTDAWLAAYTALSGAMIAAAYPELEAG